MVSPSQVSGTRITFDVEQERYLSKVLRLRSGDLLEVVIAGTGRSVTGRLEAARRGLALSIETERALPPPPGPALTLAMGLIKGPRLEAVVRAATELSVNALALIATERAVVDWSHGGREDRLAGIAVSASQQSGNAYPPAITCYDSVAAFCDSWKGALVIAVAEGGGRLDAVPRATGPLALLIGPEGDFTPEEQATARAHGAIPLTLTCPVLRAETAATVLATLMLERLGRL